MCGICGIVSRDSTPPDSGLVRRMIGRLKHRGPDASGYYRDREVALGHARLSIIDLSGGAQPLCNEDGTLWISFNGEIFNYIELADELKAAGHIFKTKSDTEVIVHAFEEWGPGCFNRFNGQWAIALWNTKTKTLVLSRDRLGIRPLYYTIQEKKILFASEVKGIFADPSVERAWDYDGLNEVFTFWCPVAPQTVFKGISQLEPGYYAVIKEGRIKKEPFWQVRFPKEQASGSEKENAERLREELINASKLRFTRSDVPVGAYLSGGIDSSITSAIVAHYTDTPLKTYSIRFKDAEFDERNYQEEMVKRLGAEHQSVDVGPEEIGEIFPEVVWHGEQPLLRTAPAPLFLLSRLVRQCGYKVVVTGEGSDEVIAGYDIFREAKVREFLARDPESKKRANIFLRLYPWMARNPGQVPAFAKAFFGKALDREDPGLSHRPRWDTTTSIKMMFTPESREKASSVDVIERFLKRLPAEHKDWDLLCRSQWLEISSLLAGYILAPQGDRMLMANSIEGRFPFLDVNFVEFCGTLPPRHKLMGLDEKHLLKKAFQDHIPESILKRPKQPYRAPDAASFFRKNSAGETILLDWAEALTEESVVKAAGIFEPQAVSFLLKKCKKVGGVKMSNTDNMRLVAVLSTMLLYDQYIKGSGNSFSDEKPAEPVTVIDRLV